MSYNDAQEQLQQFYDMWADKNSTIKENWDVIVDAVNNTVFENKSLLNFFDMVDEVIEEETFFFLFLASRSLFSSLSLNWS